MITMVLHLTPYLWDWATQVVSMYHLCNQIWQKHGLTNVPSITHETVFQVPTKT